MNRKRAVISVGLVTSLAALTGGAVWLLTHQPGFYRAALLTHISPDERNRQSEQFVKATLQLVNEIRNEERWSQEFSEQAINSWLAEELPVKYAEWLPPDVADPRVKVEKGGVWIAFRTHRGAWSGVISGRLKVWVASPNELAIEIQSLSAGLIPIPLEDIVGRFVESMNDSGWRMQWKQSASGDVLVVSLDDAVSAEGSADRAVLEAVELLPGELRVAGRRQVKTVNRTARKRALESQAVETDEDAVK